MSGLSATQQCVIDRTISFLNQGVDPCLCYVYGKYIDTYDNSVTKCQSYLNEFGNDVDLCYPISEINSGGQVDIYASCKLLIETCLDSPYAVSGFILMCLSMLAIANLRNSASVVHDKTYKSKLFVMIILSLGVVSIALTVYSTVKNRSNLKNVCRVANVVYVNYVTTAINVLTSVTAYYIFIPYDLWRWRITNAIILIGDIVSFSISLYVYLVTPGIQGDPTSQGYLGVGCYIAWAAILYPTQLYLSIRNRKNKVVIVKAKSLIAWTTVSQARLMQVIVMLSITENITTSQVQKYAGPFINSFGNISQSGLTLNISKILTTILVVVLSITLRWSKPKHVEV